MLLEVLLLVSTQLLIGECQADGIHHKKVAVSAASDYSNISCSLNLNLGNNCLEKNEIKVEMKGIIEELLQQESEILTNNLKDSIKNITESMLQQVKDGLSKEVKDIIENMKKQINGSLNEIKYEMAINFDHLDNRTLSCITDNHSESKWIRIAYLDMKNSTHQCPTGFRQTSSPKRLCGRPSGPGCVSTTFPVNGVRYSKVRGQVRAYQDKTPDAFHPYHASRATTIDSYYVDGVSITHGRSPRQHIWTFAAAVDEVHGNEYVCPCTRPDMGFSGTLPPFVGQDYFCETGSRNFWQLIFYGDDPLWDGKGCGAQSTCCSFNNPPWFIKELPQPSIDNIELRICSDQAVSNEDIPIEMFEIYIQ